MTKIAVVGDAIIDQYHFGRCDRLSPEAPCPVFVETSADSRRGGADHVLWQLEEWGVEAVGFFPPRRSVKHRYLVGHHQVFRRDSDQIAVNWDPTGIDLSGFDAIVLSDYAKGAYSEGLCRWIMQGPPVIVDPKGSDWRKYSGAYVICPNEREYEQWDRMAYFRRTLLKRGEAGIDVIEKGEELFLMNVPSQARHVFDVTGAGDVVVSAVAVGVTKGWAMTACAEFACKAAGYTVAEIGTAVCPKEYVSCELGLPTVAGTDSMPDTNTSSESA